MGRDKGQEYSKELMKAIEDPSPEMQETFKEEFELLKEICKDKKVLDVGCGAGRPVDKLADYCKKVVCIDNSKELLEIAKKNLSKKENIEIFYMDAFNMGFENNEFDVVYATYNLIGCVDSKGRLIEEMARLTKKGGTLIIFTWKRDEKTTEFLKKYYSNLGFKIKNIDKEKTVINKFIFERVDPNLIKDLFKEIGLKEIKITSVGAWNAIIGKKT